MDAETRIRKHESGSGCGRHWVLYRGPLIVSKSMDMNLAQANPQKLCSATPCGIIPRPTRNKPFKSAASTNRGRSVAMSQAQLFFSSPSWHSFGLRIRLIVTLQADVRHFSDLCGRHALHAGPVFDCTLQTCSGLPKLFNSQVIERGCFGPGRSRTDIASTIPQITLRPHCTSRRSLTDTCPTAFPAVFLSQYFHECKI